MLKIIPKLPYLRYGYMYTVGHFPLGFGNLIFSQAESQASNVATTVMLQVFSQ